jgi:hypothetical protein
MLLLPEGQTGKPGNLPKCNAKPGNLPKCNAKPGNLPKCNAKPGNLPKCNPKPGNLPKCNAKPGNLPKCNAKPGNLPKCNAKPGNLPKCKLLSVIWQHWIGPVISLFLSSLKDQYSYRLARWQEGYLSQYSTSINIDESVFDSWQE